MTTINNLNQGIIYLNEGEFSKAIPWLEDQWKALKVLPTKELLTTTWSIFSKTIEALTLSYIGLGALEQDPEKKLSLLYQAREYLWKHPDTYLEYENNPWLDKYTTLKAAITDLEKSLETPPLC